MESCPGQLCAKNLNNFAAAALHVKSLTLRNFIQLRFFSFSFSFFASSTGRFESFIFQLQKAAVTLSRIKHLVQRDIFVPLKIIKCQSLLFSSSYFWTCSYICVFDRVNETRLSTAWRLMENV